MLTSGETKDAECGEFEASREHSWDTTAVGANESPESIPNFETQFLNVVINGEGKAVASLNQYRVVKKTQTQWPIKAEVYIGKSAGTL